MVPQSSRSNPPTDAAPMYQPNIPPKNSDSLKEYLQPTNQPEAMEKPLENEEEPVYAEIGPVNSTSFNSETEDNGQTLACNSQNGQLTLYKQDACIFGGLVISQFQLQKCISFLSEIRQACEIKINRRMETPQNLDEDVEEKIKFCIETLKSFDLHYYEKFELRSYSSSDEGPESASPLESSQLKNMSASYCEMSIIKKMEDQNYIQLSVSNNHYENCDVPSENHYEDCDVPGENHYETINPAPLQDRTFQNVEVENSNHFDSAKEADDDSTHDYESISTLCLEQPKTDTKSFKDEKMNYPCTSQQQNHYETINPAPLQDRTHQNVEVENNNHFDSAKEADDVSTHDYEGISALFLEQPKTGIKSFKDEKMNYPCTSQQQNYYETINPAPLQDRTHQNVEVENNNHFDSAKEVDDVSTHDYEGISTLFLEQPKTDIKSFEDEKMNYPSTSQQHYYANLPSNEDPIQKLFLETLIGKKSKSLPAKAPTGSTDSDQIMMSQDLQNVNDRLDECYSNTALVLETFYGFYEDDEEEEFNPLILDTHCKRCRMVAKWVMTVDPSLGVEEDEIAPEMSVYAEGFELQDKEEGPKDGKNQLTVRTTAL